jgi:hypothetical protein
MSTIQTRIATLADLDVIAPLFDGYRQFYDQAPDLALAESGKTRMDLTTAKANKPAQAAYESLGWVRDEIYCAYSKSVDA